MIKVWVAGTLKINTTDSDIASGGLGLGGDSARFGSIKVDYDNNGDDDIDDAGDDLAYQSDFSTTSTTIVYDDNGNLTQDQRFKYEYDAWNRLVTVRTLDEVTIQNNEYSGNRHRIKSIVSNSGSADGTTYYYNNHKWQLIEKWSGSEEWDQRIIRGVLYIDEVIRNEITNQGTTIVFQDAQRNVTSITNYAGAVLERIDYAPYGAPQFNVASVNGDYDGDGDVDSADNAALTSCISASPVGACRIFDFDVDGDVDAADETVFDGLFSALPLITRVPRREQSQNSVLQGFHGLGVARK